MNKKSERYIWEMVSNAARTGRYFTEEERELDGLKVFKKKVLGRFRLKSEKSLQELVELAGDLGIAQNVDEAIKFTESLDGARLIYSSKYSNSILAIDKVRNAKGYERYRFRAWTL